MTHPQPAPTLDVLIVGAGFAGLYMLHAARRGGLCACIVEATASVGGTWYQNRYPGARVDIPSLEYSFGFDEALQQEWHWSERYASQPELLRYANHVADRFGLRDGIHFNRRVTSLCFDEAESLWRVRCSDGQAWSARFVVMACGPLSSPNTPQFPGLESFAGPVYHTAQWPHEAVDFTGQRVAIVGTGSSAVQAIPLISKQARELTVFQRTAAYTVPAHNAPLDPQYEARIKADYAGFRARTSRMRAGIGSEWPPAQPSTLAVDAATREATYEERWRIGGFSLLGAFSDTMIDPRANAFAAEFVRNKIRATVRDPQVAARLCPTHTLGCKRLCVDTGYYETFNRSNVQLIDVSDRAGADPIVAIAPRGVRTKTREFDADALVLATGFDAMTGTLMRLDLQGRGGLTIQDKWRAGPLTYLGLMIAGFPNLFNVVGPGCPAAFTNVMLSIEQHVNWIAQCIADVRGRGRQTIEATPQAEAAWVEHVNAVAQATLYLSCNSWYLGANIPGKPRMFMPLLGFPPYADKCAEVARNGYEGFALA